MKNGRAHGALGAAVKEEMVRSPLLDGPLQRQLLLMKLSHELKNRPNFGPEFIADPDHEVREWISRVKVIVDRAGIRNSIEFGSAIAMMNQYWAHSVNSLLSIAKNTVEELKLELELYQDEQIGEVYKAGETYRFATDLLNVVSGASKSVFVVDPYFDATSFSLFFSRGATFSVRVLLSNKASEVIAIADKFKKETGNEALVLKTKKIHDRLIIIDEQDCWLMGASIKDAAQKPTYLMPLPPELALQKVAIYDEIWKEVE